MNLLSLYLTLGAAGNARKTKFLNKWRDSSESRHSFQTQFNCGYFGALQESGEYRHVA